jgi:hypothetical protein
MRKYGMGGADSATARQPAEAAKAEAPAAS